jgi:hypothetical protein
MTHDRAFGGHFCNRSGLLSRCRVTSSISHSASALAVIPHKFRGTLGWCLETRLGHSAGSRMLPRSDIVLSENSRTPTRCRREENQTPRSHEPRVTVVREVSENWLISGRFGVKYGRCGDSRQLSFIPVNSF